MARKTKRAKLLLTEKQRAHLEQISNSRKGSLREVQRAKILLHYSDEMPITLIQQRVNVSRPTIYKYRQSVSRRCGCRSQGLLSQTL